MLSVEERSNLTFQLITEFSFTALQSLVDVAGSLRAIELNKPYWHHAGKAAGLVALQSFPGLMTKDIQGWVFMSKFIEAVFRRGSSIRSVPGKPSFQGVIDHCPFENGPPEFCYLLDYVVANGVIESLDLNIEFLLDASMAEGAPVCVFTIIKKDRGADQGGVVPIDVKVPDIPREVLDSFAIQYLGEHWVMISRAIDDYEGREQVLNTLQARLRKLGYSRATQLMEAVGRSTKDKATILAILDLINDLLLQDGDYVGLATGEEKRMTKCPFQFSPASICDQFEAYTNGVIEAIDPRHVLVHPTAMCRGDDHCVRAIITDGEREQGA